jgi:hypothetical protein
MAAQSPEPVLGQPIPTISLETYHQILDLIFAPKDKPRSAVAFTLSVRVDPAFRAESQINLTLLPDQTARGEYVVTDKNVYYASNKLLQSTREGRVEALAEKTSVKRHALNLPPDLLMKWQTQLIEGLSANFLALQPDLQKVLLRQPATLVLDGDSYEVWYAQGQTAIHVSFSQAAMPTPLEIWAEAVHSVAQKAALPTNQ